MTVATTVGINGSVPYQVRVTLERPEPEDRKTRPSKGAIPTSGLEAHQRERAPQVPSIH
jgi:hypothetical protein